MGKGGKGKGKPADGKRADRRGFRTTLQQIRGGSQLGGASPLVAFDFDCTITVRHFYKVLAWGWMSGNEKNHAHCAAVFAWLREKDGPTQQNGASMHADPIMHATESLVQSLGPEGFKELARELFLGGEERIAWMSAWFAEQKANGVEFCIITAGVCSAVSMFLYYAVPEWITYFPSENVLDCGANRHNVNGVTPSKVLIIRDLRPYASTIVFVDDSLGKDPVPQWILGSARVTAIDLPYEGPGISQKTCEEIEAALAAPEDSK